MRFCPQCETTNHDTATGCRRCGRALTSGDYVSELLPAAERERERRRGHAATTTAVREGEPGTGAPLGSVEPRMEQAHAAPGIARRSRGPGSAHRRAAMPKAVPLLLLLGGAAALLVVVGSLGPWAQVFGFAVNGTSADGVLTLIGAIAAGVLLLVAVRRPSRRMPFLVVAALFLAGSDLVGLIDWVHVETRPEIHNELGDFDPTVASGLVMTTLAGWAGAAFLALQLAADASRGR